MPRTKLRTRLAVETLEGRIVPAAPLDVVTAALVNGVLTISGDDATNVVGVHKDESAGQVTVSGFFGTSIDVVGTSSKTFSLLVNSIKASLKGGADIFGNDAFTSPTFRTPVLEGSRDASRW